MHDDVIKWKHSPRYWPFVRGIHRSPVNSAQKGKWRGALLFSLICAWINGWVNNLEAGELRRHRAHYDVTVIRIPTQRHIEMASCKMICWSLYYTELYWHLTIWFNVFSWCKPEQTGEQTIELQWFATPTRSGDVTVMSISLLLRTNPSQILQYYNTHWGNICEDIIC